MANEKGETSNIAFLKDDQRVVNCHCFGSVNNPGQWQCPVSDDLKEVGLIKFTNVRARKVFEKMEYLVEICVVDGEITAWWMKALGHYRAAMKLLLSHVDLTGPEVFEFQRRADYYSYY